MKVHGIEITQAHIDAAIARMKEGPFKAAEICAAIHSAGEILDEVAYRAADRIIQDQRKAKNIAMTQKCYTWHWVGK